MYNNLRVLFLIFLAMSFSTFADEVSPAQAYTFKVYADEDLFWEGYLADGDEIETKALGLPAMPQCYSPMVAPQFTKVFCPPNLRIMRGRKASHVDVNCDGFLLVEDYIDRWDKTKSKGNTIVAPVKVSHHMCIGAGDNINFIAKTGDGWLKKTTYRVELLKQ